MRQGATALALSEGCEVEVEAATDDEDAPADEGEDAELTALRDASDEAEAEIAEDDDVVALLRSKLGPSTGSA